MRQRVFALLLLLSAIFPQYVMAAEDAPTTSTDIYGWERIDSLNTDPAFHDTVNLIKDETYGYAVEVIKQSPSKANSQLGLRQYIDKSMLTEGHTYVFECEYKMNKPTTTFWLQAGFRHNWVAGGVPRKGYSEPASVNDGDKGWKHIKIELPYTTEAFSGKLPDKLNVTFMNANGPGKYWLADVKVYDKEDVDKTNLLSNGDFSKQFRKLENVRYSDGVLSWDSWDDLTGIGINIYQRSLKGDRILLNDEPIPMEELQTQINIDNTNSCYIDVYACEIVHKADWEESLVSIAVEGKIDFFDYKFYNGTKEISKLEKGTITVAYPIENNAITDGYEMEMIVLLKEGNITRKISKAAYKVMPSEGIVEYTVDINVDCEVDENTHLEVYVWDSIDAMNVLSDVYTF